MKTIKISFPLPGKTNNTSSQQFLFMYGYIYLFLAAVGLRCHLQDFSSCGKRGLLPVAGHGPLTAVASLAVEHRCMGF